ncbi:ATP-binding protein [Streptomyces hydrogenans]|uniref:ATP-binding protein n=1 Tax=Streptomyces hydrogenans TaxID=1873719 RepID=UPI0038118EC0
MAAGAFQTYDLHAPHAPARARQHLRRFARDAAAHGTGISDEAQTDAALVVSELVDNAVRHAGGTITLALGLTPDGLSIEVSDESAVPPSLHPPDWAGEGGFGWGLVTRLSSHVTVTLHARGKTIHACVPLLHGPASTRPEKVRTSRSDSAPLE